MEKAMEQTMDKSVRWWNRKAASYAKRSIADMAAYEEKLAITREYLTPNTRVLEFGCGTGSTALLHAPYVKQIVAIDSSQKMVEIASGKLGQSEVSNVEFRHATLFDLPRKPGSFDVFLGLNILHLLDDMDAGIARIYELLEPGGTFISSTACLAGEMGLLKFVLPIGGKLGLIPRVQIIDKETLEKSITQVGFRIVKNIAFNKNGMAKFIVAQK